MSKIEETRREMYRLLAHMKSNPTGVVLMSEFESAMEAHLEVLRQKAKRTGRISQIKAWMRAAVRDNQRLRKDRKAFLETQAEHLNEIQRLRMVLDTQNGTCGCTGCATKNYGQAMAGIQVCASPASLQEAGQ